ncbi:hypothetical protein [Flavobacterium sp. 3HN19-14]|uniref:hypothetical protein n=1 Tax=Flavobacterium sp. 3HN19-14 TaxID=3448133 RepID=UPI003EE2B07C
MYIIPVKSRRSEVVTKAIARTINQLDPEFRKSMTHDNGVEMANHKWLKSSRL